MTSSPSIKDLLALCKLKVVSLILLTAVVGMLLAVPYVPNLLLIVIASIGISWSAMSAAVFNHSIDEKIDLQMSRTDRRPLPKGKVTRNQALVWGLFGLLALLCCFSSSESLTWVVVAGWVMVLLVSPRFAVIEIILVLLIRRKASFLPPITSNDTIPP